MCAHHPSMISPLLARDLSSLLVLNNLLGFAFGGIPTIVFGILDAIPTYSYTSAKLQFLSPGWCLCQVLEGFMVKWVVRSDAVEGTCAPPKHLPPQHKAQRSICPDSRGSTDCWCLGAAQATRANTHALQARTLTFYCGSRRTQLFRNLV